MIFCIDQLPGSGKTCAAINYMNEHSDRKFIYVTPYLSEVERIKSCVEEPFFEPIKYTDLTPKLVDLKLLLLKEANIVTSHSLFSYFDDDIISLCHASGYTLIMDETHDVVSPYQMRSYDVQTVLERYTYGDNPLSWRDDADDSERFADVKEACKNGCLNNYHNQALIWMFPIKAFEAFQDVFILTYMFDSQIQSYYYKYHKIEYKHMWVKGDSPNNYHFTDEPQKDVFNPFLIRIEKDYKLNLIGDGEYSLSKEWFSRAVGSPLLKKLKNNMENFFGKKLSYYNDVTKEYEQSSSCHNLWTTFADYKSYVAGKGYTKGFIPLNSRATNNYRDRTVVAYSVNRFMNPIIKNFLLESNIIIDEEGFALSEMLQFLWRSGVRDGKRITVYIPSIRMRRLLKRWLDTYEN